jgi:hypothetical protein
VGLPEFSSFDFFAAAKTRRNDSMAGTQITRAEYHRDEMRYARETTDEDWDVIEPHLLAAASCGRPRRSDLRDVVEAILYRGQSVGCYLNNDKGERFASTGDSSYAARLSRLRFSERR